MFSLATSVAVAAVGTGATEVTTVGALTLGGVSAEAPVVIMAREGPEPGLYELVATLPVSFSDYGLNNPSNAFVTVRDEGLVEVFLTLSR